jgi:hypothetical protein
MGNLTNKNQSFRSLFGNKEQNRGQKETPTDKSRGLEQHVSTRKLEQTIKIHSRLLIAIKKKTPSF